MKPHVLKRNPLPTFDRQSLQHISLVGKSAVCYPTTRPVIAGYDRTNPLPITQVEGGWKDWMQYCLALTDKNWCFVAPWPMKVEANLNIEWSDPTVEFPGDISKRPLTGNANWCGLLLGTPTVEAIEIDGGQIMIDRPGNSSNKSIRIITLNTGQYIQGVMCLSSPAQLCPSWSGRYATCNRLQFHIIEEL